MLSDPASTRRPGWKVNICLFAEFILNDSLVRELDENWETVAPQLLHFHDKRVPEEKDKALLAQKIRKHYLGNQTLVEAKPELLRVRIPGTQQCYLINLWY